MTSSKRRPAVRPGRAAVAGSRIAASTRRRVSGATSERPLITFETVGTETPGPRRRSRRSCWSVGYAARRLGRCLESVMPRSISKLSGSCSEQRNARRSAIARRRTVLTTASPARMCAGRNAISLARFETFEPRRQSRRWTPRSRRTAVDTGSHETLTRIQATRARRDWQRRSSRVNRAGVPW